MKSNKINTPIGTKDKLFEESKKIKGVIRSLEGVFEEKGYSEIITPTFEYMDVYKTPKSPLPEELMYKFVENSGRLLVLRPDMTIPIARVAATKIMDDAFPVRLFYVDDVYRMTALGSTQFSEIKQAGIELIGACGIEADIEVISLGIEALRAANLQNFKIEIGYAAGVDTKREQYLNQIREALNAMGFEKYIGFDFDMVNEMDYYTGIILQGYAKGIGKAILSGGRYDNLISDFGKDLPAVGFAIDVLGVAGGIK